MDDNNRNYNEIATFFNTFSIVIVIIGFFVNYSLFIAMIASFLITIIMVAALLPKDIDINDNIDILNNIEEGGKIIATVISTTLAIFVWLTIIIYNLLDK